MTCNINTVIQDDFDYRGDDWEYDFYIKDNTGKPVDITGGTLTFTLKVANTDITPVLQVDGVIVSALEGQFNVAVSDTETLDIDIGIYKYAVQYTDSLGKSTTIFQGDFEVLHNTTNA